MIKVRIEQMPHGIGLDLPKYATADSAGVDLMAAIDQDTVLKSGARCLVPSGFIIALPRGFEGQIRPRSGLALKNGLTVLNTPGTIDADYRGEVKVILINLGQEDFAIMRGMRIAQLVIAPVVQVSFEKVENLEHEKTSRSSGGFGSTGLS